MITKATLQTKTNLIFGAMAVLIILVIAWMLLAEPKVAVKIYKHTESGNYIYCETGELNDEFHTYEGEGKIAESKAVAC